ncbi:MAG: type II toxin-antitoxin system VapB family antitoxin [bacterium]|nr:type II toxin-antitoxin system VapB family antitoxin [bacterium]
MKTARLFTNGRSQAVRLPKDCRFEGTDVYVQKFNQMIILVPKDKVWETFMEGLELFSEDFMEERNQPSQQVRETL